MFPERKQVTVFFLVFFSLQLYNLYTYLHISSFWVWCVAPVVITALAPTLDKSLKGDRSLCPVRALRYYLDRTLDLMQNKELVFVSFNKGFDKDISPATISSLIKQTVILCYELSDQEALTLHQVKAHDVRAFAASKAFQSGVSLVVSL